MSWVKNRYHYSSSSEAVQASQCCTDFWLMFKYKIYKNEVWESKFCWKNLFLLLCVLSSLLYFLVQGDMTQGGSEKPGVHGFNGRFSKSAGKWTEVICAPCCYTEAGWAASSGSKQYSLLLPGEKKLEGPDTAKRSRVFPCFLKGKGMLKTVLWAFQQYIAGFFCKTWLPDLWSRWAGWLIIVAVY